MRRALTTLVLIALAAACAAAAAAGAPGPAAPTSDPVATCDQAAQNACDTELTPVPKDGCEAGWTQVAGAVFDGEQPCKGYDPKSSVTPSNLDLFTVRFALNNGNNGWAGGAVCSDPSVATLDACPDTERIPAMYHYDGRSWSAVPLPGGAGGDAPTHGYVGAIAFMADGHVLAVGGTGVFPRREGGQGPSSSNPLGDPSTPQNDPAGLARAWVYDGTAWSEVTRLPAELDGPPMRGFDAVDCSPRRSDSGGEMCFAGAYQQLWKWTADRFAAGYDQATPESQMVRAYGLSFRVRAIRFVPGADDPPQGQPWVIALTAGCCAVSPVTGQRDPSLDTPRILTFDGTQWTVDENVTDPYSDETETICPAVSAWTAPWGQGLHVPTEVDCPSTLLSLTAPFQQESPGGTTADNSYYALYVSFGPRAGTGDGQGTLFSPVVAPGGPAPGPGGPPEPSSEPPLLTPPAAGAGPPYGLLVASSIQVPYNQAFPGASTYVGGRAVDASAIRLVAADGDASPTASGLDASSLGEPSFNAPDGVFDWAVGELTADHQAVVYTTTQAGVVNPSTVSCSGQQLASGVPQPTSCQPNSASEIQAQMASRSLFTLPSYALNSVAALGQSGVYWAVGDRGAIAELGAAAVKSPPEGNPPAVGSAEPAGLTNEMAFSPFRESASGSQVGVVPALSFRPLVAETSPQWVSYGSPAPFVTGSAISGQEQVRAMVMSEDGTEGWAVGGGGGQLTTLYHYADDEWRRCDPEGVSGVIAPDAACDSLAGLFHWHDQTGSAKPVNIVAITRVPLASHAFEAMAVGTEYSETAGQPPRDVVLRYRDGHWMLDWQAMQELEPTGTNDTFMPLSIAFSGPDDGWLTSGFNSQIGDVYHFDGSHWRECTSSAPCDDPNHLVPVSSGGTNPVWVTSVGSRVYLYGSRNVSANGSSAAYYPLILYKDRGEPWTASHGGFDPGCISQSASGCVPTTDSTQQGFIAALSVAHDNDGYEGWAVGRFGAATSLGESNQLGVGNPELAGFSSGLATASILRLSADGTVTASPTGGAADEYLGSRVASQPSTTGLPLILAVARPHGSPLVVASPAGDGTGGPEGPILTTEGPDRGWSVLPTSWSGVQGTDAALMAELRALAPDGSGGFWAAIENKNFGSIFHTFFFHYTSAVHKAVFTDVPQPVREPVSALVRGAGATVWLATASNTLYRYDRITGWEQLRIPSWDQGQLATNSSAAYGLAVNDAGQGVVVGQGGRIADISSAGVVLDAAAGVLCSRTVPVDLPPCGTSRDLRAAAVAPDGSAMVGGDDRQLLWRPPGDPRFRAISPPSAPGSATITGVALPGNGHAWVTTDTGQIYRGTADGSSWAWQLESVDSVGDSLTSDADGTELAVRAIALDSSGRGFAVGDRGLILERVGGAVPWRRLDSGVGYNLHSVAIAPQGQPGALIGGEYGLVLTYIDGRFQIARPADPYDPLTRTESFDLSSPMVGVAIVPGDRPGEVEAWAAEQVPANGLNRSPAPGAILHYTSDPFDSLLDAGVDRVRPLPDAPPRQPGEITIAAFGKQDCQGPSPCPEMTGTDTANEAIAARIVQSIAAAGPTFSIFTGDADDHAGYGAEGRQVYFTGRADSSADRSLVHERWRELVADPLETAGVPVFGAVGVQDLSSTQDCESTLCAGSASAGVGLNIAWRAALSGMPAPWGAPGNRPVGNSGGFSFVPLPASGQEGPSASTPTETVTAPTATTPSATVPDPAGSPVTVPSYREGGPQTVAANTVSTSGAHTHYAFDIERAGTPVLRVVVVDSSLRTLSGAAAEQNPAEVQLKWLSDVLSSRPAGERAIVVSETPSYSYGPGSGTDTLCRRGS